MQPRDPSIADYLFGPGEPESGVVVTETTALNVAAIWAGVNIISSSLASMPIDEYIRAGETQTRIDDTNEARLLREPNPEMTSVMFRETLQAHSLLGGNGYAEVERNGRGEPVNLWPIPPTLVRADRDMQNRLFYWVRDPKTYKEEPIPARDMLHIPGLGFDGVQGYNVVRMARESFGLTIAQERYAAALFGRGARPDGFVATDKKMSDEAVKNFKRTWYEEHQGLPNAHRIAVLHDGMKWNALSQNNNDAQFLESRKFQIEEIARWLNLPPHLLRHLDHATFSNIEHQGREYVTYTLLPLMTKWEQELARKLLMPSSRASRFFRFDADSLLRGDMLTRYKAWLIARQAGFVNVNDIRKEENMNPLPGDLGTNYLVPVNYVSAENIDEIGATDVGNPNGPGGPSNQPGE